MVSQLHSKFSTFKSDLVDWFCEKVIWHWQNDDLNIKANSGFTVSLNYVYKDCFLKWLSGLNGQYSKFPKSHLVLCLWIALQVLEMLLAVQIGILANETGMRCHQWDVSVEVWTVVFCFLPLYQLFQKIGVFW